MFKFIPCYLSFYYLFGMYIFTFLLEFNSISALICLFSFFYISVYVSKINVISPFLFVLRFVFLSIWVVLLLNSRIKSVICLESNHFWATNIEGIVLFLPLNSLYLWCDTDVYWLTLDGFLIICIFVCLFDFCRWFASFLLLFWFSIKGRMNTFAFLWIGRC